MNSIPNPAPKQSQLQQYIAGKKLDDFFVEMTENLLVESPDNPVKFIIDYLFKNYPDQARDSQFAKTFSTGGVRGIQGSLLTGLTIQADSCTDSEEESDDSDDEFDSAPVLFTPRSTPSTRRHSICGESIKLNTGDSAKLPKYHKSKSQIDHIEAILLKSVLFQHLSLEKPQLLQVVETMFPVTYSEGEKIIKQGDVGDNFYVIDEGTCQVSITHDDGTVSQVQTCNKGDSFGELALMYNAPRAATVQSTSEVKLWALDRRAYKTILMEQTLKRREEYKKLLEKIPILEPLTEYERLTIADSLVKTTYKKDQVLIRQNEIGHHFFILVEGTVVCSQQQSPQQDPVVIAELDTGSYFGEIALLTDRPRAATVVATSDQVVCLTLERKTFSRLTGNLVGILKRNMKLYQQFVGDKI